MEIRKTVRYTVNGREYASLDEVPEAFRKLLEDKDADGVPDLLQKLGARTVVSRTWWINGKTYHHLEDIPPELRPLEESGRTFKVQWTLPSDPTQRACLIGAAVIVATTLSLLLFVLFR